MKDIFVDDIISASFGLFLKYSDIINASKEKDKYGRFLIKKFTNDGHFKGKFCYTSDAIFTESQIKPYTLKFNPEKLI